MPPLDLTVNLAPLYKVELIEKWNAHFYRKEGETDVYPGVTTVLQMVGKPYLVPWAAKETANKIREYLIAHAVNRALSMEEITVFVDTARKQHIVKRDDAADIGTRAHKAINAWIEDRMDDFKLLMQADDIHHCVDAFLKWQESSEIKIRLGDTKILSSIHGYGGSLDALGFLNGDPVLIDFKTSNQISDEYAYQVSAYVQAFDETYGFCPKKAVILRLGKTKPEFEPVEIVDIADCFDGFLAAQTLYHLKSRQKFLPVV